MRILIIAWILLTLWSDSLSPTYLIYMRELVMGARVRWGLTAGFIWVPQFTRGSPWSWFQGVSLLNPQHTQQTSLPPLTPGCQSIGQAESHFVGFTLMSWTCCVVVLVSNAGSRTILSQTPGGSEDAWGWVAAAMWLLPMLLSSSLLRECGFCGMPIRGWLRAFSIIGRTSPGHVWLSIWSESDLRGSMILRTLGAGISGESSGQLPAWTDFRFILCPLLLFCPALPPLPHQAVPLPATTNSTIRDLFLWIYSLTAIKMQVLLLSSLELGSFLHFPL